MAPRRRTACLRSRARRRERSPCLASAGSLRTWSPWCRPRVCATRRSRIRRALIAGPGSLRRRRHGPRRRRRARRPRPKRVRRRFHRTVRSGSRRPRPRERRPGRSACSARRAEKTMRPRPFLSRRAAARRRDRGSRAHHRRPVRSRLGRVRRRCRHLEACVRSRRLLRAFPCRLATSRRFRPTRRSASTSPLARCRPWRRRVGPEAVEPWR